MRRSPSVVRLLLQIAGDGLLGRILDTIDVPGARLELHRALRPEDDPAPYLRALEAIEASQRARRDLQDALGDILLQLNPRPLGPPR